MCPDYTHKSSVEHAGHVYSYRSITNAWHTEESPERMYAGLIKTDAYHKRNMAVHAYVDRCRPDVIAWQTLLCLSLLTVTVIVDADHQARITKEAGQQPRAQSHSLC